MAGDHLPNRDELELPPHKQQCTLNSLGTRQARGLRGMIKQVRRGGGGPKKRKSHCSQLQVTRPTHLQLKNFFLKMPVWDARLPVTRHYALLDSPK
jgi:hypothetical protein